MIKFENTDVMNFDNAIRGMRNPMNSWDKSDSDVHKVPECTDCPHHNTSCHKHILSGNACFHLGENDLALCQKLIKGGPVHSKFLRQILVSVDITAPLYWWKEFDTYKVGTVANSCSTMHKIHSKEFTLDDFSCEHLMENGKQCLKNVIAVLNGYREHFLKDKEKDNWWQMIQLLPTSYNQKRTVTLNYEILRNIRHWRKNHKLDEWSIGFMDWINTLPYAEELINFGMEVDGDV